ncbi:MAG: hypothetical protein LUH19_07190 [Lachnospiraceae bacterium]|nr:hypothetical protein [Lachnospiraceae bacterium]
MKHQDGVMVVEAVISFMVFIMVTLAIVSLTNIFMIHNKVQFAINSAAHEIASYSYLYQALGLNDAVQTLEEDGSSYTGAIDDTTSKVVEGLNDVQEVYSQINGLGSTVSGGLDISKISSVQSQLSSLNTSVSEAGTSVKEAAASVKSLFSDTNGLIAGIIYMGVSGATYTLRSIVGTAAAQALTEKYLKQGSQSADAYLKGMGVQDGYSGLDFDGSTLFCDSDGKIVDIVVEYDIDLSFLQLVLPQSTLHVVQRVSVAGWLDGDGQEVSVTD